MGSIPRVALRHRLIVEPYLGMTGNGPRYGDPVAVRAHVEDGHRTKRSTSSGGSRETGDEGSAWTELRWAHLITPEARVRLYSAGGRLVEVTKVQRREFPGMPTPDHLEITFT